MTNSTPDIADAARMYRLNNPGMKPTWDVKLHHQAAFVFTIVMLAVGLIGNIVLGACAAPLRALLGALRARR